MLCDIGNGVIEVQLISEAKDFRVNESEISTVVFQLLTHYFSYDIGQRYI